MNDNEKLVMWLIIIFFVGALLIRLTWSKLVFHDMRCAFAECRIIK